MDIPHISQQNDNKNVVTENGSLDTDFDSFAKIKTDSLKESIDDIETMIDEREVLSEEFDKEADMIKNKIVGFVSEHNQCSLHDSDFFRERAELRKKEIDVFESQLDEKINCWKDIALLKKELRERQKELNEKESRMAALNEIL